MHEIVDRLRQAANDYVPSEAVSQELSDVVVAPVFGPAAIGKNTCLSAVANMDPEFGVSQSFTTRPRQSRDADGEYRFLTHDAETLGQLLGQVEGGELVQYAVHPTTDFIYGSEPSDYVYPNVMRHCLTTSVADLRELPFKRIVEIALVMEAEEWVKRFERTRADDPADMAKRLLEARQSLEWSLDQDGRIAWVNNATDCLGSTARELRGVIRGDLEPNPRNRLLGERLLKAIHHKIDS